MNAGLPVPEGFHITTQAYRLFVDENGLQPIIEANLGQVDLEKPTTIEDAAERIRKSFLTASIPSDVASAIVGAYDDLSGREPAVAVRSSATAEDLPEASFAGQQESYLNVSGAENVLEATKKCWSSLWTARAISYRARQGVDTKSVALAVVVQKLVPAEVAGILFTVNPIDGNRDQAQISAAWGIGDAVVGGRVTPDDYIVDKLSGRLVRRQVADKEVMTVRVNGATEDQPVPESLRTLPVLEDDDLRELTHLGVQIEELFGMPMDVEWALADSHFSIVQARPITALPEVAVPPPDEWELPEPKERYMRTSIVDFMPDPLSPLFATMGVRAYNDGLQQMMFDITDSERVLPEEIIVTIHDYAYMKVNFSAREWWSMLSKLAPRLISLIRNGPDHFRETALPEYQEKVGKLDKKPVADMPAINIWRDAHELIHAAVYHLSILQVDTLGAAAGSEGLFTAIYNRFFRREGDPQASTFLMGYDTTPIRSEKSLYDLAEWVLGQPALSDYILETNTAEITNDLSSMEMPAGVTPAVWEEWKRRVEAHLKSFGYILYDLDFAKPVPAEDPTPSLETVKMYMRGQGVNPHERQEKLERAREKAIEQLLARARGLRGWAVRKALNWATSLAQVREDSIASIGLAYPRLRELLKELGQRMVRAGAIAKPTDIFWLEETEIEGRLNALDQGEQLESMQEVVNDRKKIRQAEQKVMPPTQLPYSETYMGIPIEAFIPGEGGHEGNRLKGVGASGGKVTGIACVLHGPEDFDQMQQGSILVAKLTTPAWTPLFAMAGGVVTDIGGPLSHGSLVAREYGIPAVLGTGAATRIIQSGQKITVDGDAGYVTLQAEE
jgi:pyruvate,water dikinase